MEDLPADKADWQYLPVSAHGYFDNAHQFLLDNRIHRQRVGYEVITPFRLAQSGKIVLINRGWVPADVDRRILPLLPPVVGEKRIQGIIRVPQGTPLTLKKDDILLKTWPKRIQSVNFMEVEKALTRPVYPFIVLLSADSDYGFVRDWQFINMQPQRHRAYAVQWFAFAVLLIILYLALNIRRRE